jgi:hypothetical protein
MSTEQKQILSTEKSREQVVQRKSLVVRQKVSLRAVVCQRVARLQVIQRRVVREEKCPKWKRLHSTPLTSQIFRQSFEAKSAECLWICQRAEVSRLLISRQWNWGRTLVPQIGHNDEACCSGGFLKRVTVPRSWTKLRKQN